MVFDDSFQHEAWNDNAEQPRLVLIFDIWHPDLTPSEVKFLQFMNVCRATCGCVVCALLTRCACMCARVRHRKPRCELQRKHPAHSSTTMTTSTPS